MKTHYAWLAGTAVIVLVAVATALRSGERDSPNDQDRIPAAARQEIKSVEREIDRIEAESLKQSRSVTLDRFQEITLLGKLIFYDKELSVKRNETCAFCHMPEDGFQRTSQRAQPNDCSLPRLRSHTLTPEEKAGYGLFRSKATHCNECHRDGGPGEEPLFTDFTASNLGLPANPDLPFYKENTPDKFGYTANPEGIKYLDPGVGGFLSGPLNPDREWAAMAKSFLGKYKTPKFRNVDKRPNAGFVKAYMHNGYLKALKEVVHFYNTRDALPKCKPGDPGEKLTCWPAPENLGTINRKQLGDLKLSDEQENLLVAFLKTLTDGYSSHEK